jgi:hypothetical protein
MRPGSHAKLFLPRRRLLAGAAASLLLPRYARADVLSPGLRNRSTGQMKRPGIPRIDRTHPLAQGLLFYAFDTGAGVVLELAGARPGAVVAGSVANPSVVTPWGYGLGWSANGSLAFSSDAAIRNATAAPPWTAACAYDMNATVGLQGTPFGRTANNNASQPFENWSFDTAVAGNGNTRFGWNNGGLFNTFTWTGQLQNAFTSVGIVAASASTVLNYAQGALVNTATSQTVQSVNTTDSIGISGLSSAGLAGTFRGVVFYGGFWARALLASEILQLHFDPYAFLIFPDDEIFGVGR